MDLMYDDLLKYIFQYLDGLRPILAQVCKRWSLLSANLKSYRWSRLAEFGYIDLMMLPESRPISHQEVFHRSARAITIASEFGYIDIVKLCLIYGANRHAVNHSMSKAASFGHIEIMKLLWESGADPSEAMGNTIYFASENRELGAIQFETILSWGATDFMSGIKCAANCGMIDYVIRFRELGETYYIGAMRGAAANGYNDMLLMLYEWNESNPKLSIPGEYEYDLVMYEAITCGNIEAVKLCLEWGLPRHELSECKKLAIEWNHCEIAKLIDNWMS